MANKVKVPRVSKYSTGVRKLDMIHEELENHKLDDYLSACRSRSILDALRAMLMV